MMWQSYDGLNRKVWSLPALASEWRQYLQSGRASGPFAPDSARYFQDIGAVQDAYTHLFTALSAGQAVSAQRYQALDEARIAADHAAYAVAESKLQEFHGAP